MIMRRFSSKGDVDQAWQYVLQVRPMRMRHTALQLNLQFTFHLPLPVAERRREADQLPGPTLLSRSHPADQPAEAVGGERRPDQAHRDGAHQRQVKLRFTAGSSLCDTAATQAQSRPERTQSSVWKEL